MDRSLLAPLSLFAVVARLKSFRAASRETGLSPSAISHAVSSLEASLGVRLLNRTTRSVSETPEGAALLASLTPALSTIAEAVDGLGASMGEPTGSLRISLPRSAFETVVLPKLARFREAFPRLHVDLSLEEAFVDLVAEGFDAGIRLSEAVEQDMIRVAVSGPLRIAIVASPGFCERHGQPVHPSELPAFPGIHRRFASGQIYRWEFARGQERIATLPQAAMLVNDSAASIQAAIEGVGIALAIRPQIETALAEGRLVSLLEAWLPPFDGFALFYPSRRQMRPALRAFIDHFRLSG